MMLFKRIFVIACSLLIVDNTKASDYLNQLEHNIESIKVIRVSNKSYPPILLGIVTRLPANTNAKDADLVTFTHEGTHFLCRGAADNKHAIYIDNGKRVLLPIPPIKTLKLFNSIPLKERGSIYNTYKSQGNHRYWQSRPTMVIEEWIAYTHGSIARQQLKLQDRSESDRYCAIMANYCWHLIKLCEQANWGKTNSLIEFCEWNNERCAEEIPNWKQLFDKRFKTF